MSSRIACRVALAALVALVSAPILGASHAYAPPDRNVLLLGQQDSYSQYADIWGYTTPGGDEWAIMGTLNGTTIIDATDPASMTEVVFIPGPFSQWRDMKTWGNHAYIVTEGTGAGTGLQVVDLSTDPPELVNTYAIGFTSAHNIYIDENGFAYIVGTATGTQILSLADPVNPVQVGLFGDYYVHDAYARSNVLYVSEMSRGHLELLDVSDKSTIVPMGSVTYEENFPHNVWLTDDGNYALTTDERAGGHLRVFDVTNPANIVQVGSYLRDVEQSIHNVTVRGDFAYTSYYIHGLRVVDVTDPRFPSEVGGYDTFPGPALEHDVVEFNGAWGVYPYSPSGNVYLSDLSTGLYVFSFTPDFGVVTGNVTESGVGTPVQDAVVLVEGGETVESLADGYYRVTSPPGVLQLRVSKFGFHDAVGSGSAVIGSPQTLDVNFVRRPSGTLAGFVTTASGTIGLESATVQVEGTPLIDTSVVGGSWSVGPIPEGFYRVRVELSGYVPRVLDVTVVEGAAVPLDADLTPAIVHLDMESDPGWTVGDPSDTASTGIWERVDPNGTSGGSIAPEDDASPDPGVLAWVTGDAPAGSGIGVNDVDGGSTTLTSAVIAVDSIDPPPMLRYRRWYVNNGNSNVDDTLLIEISDDGGASWSTLEDLAESETPWQAVDVDLAPFVLSGSVRLRFIASDLLSGSIVEAGIDELSVLRTCQVAVNPFLPDADADGVTDSCDPCPMDPFDDADSDGICGFLDNAPDVPNPDQADADGDWVGDVADNCPDDSNADQVDADGDGLGNACDPDDDNDGVLDGPDQDDDGDGVNDNVDVCPDHPDPGQEDEDNDGTGDACDPADGLLTGLRVAAGGRLTWMAEAVDAYRLYRGDLPAVDAGAGACLGPDRTVAAALDPFLPARGEGFYYLVGGVVAGVGLPPGRDSVGLRGVPACP